MLWLAEYREIVNGRESARTYLPPALQLPDISKDTEVVNLLALSMVVLFGDRLYPRSKSILGEKRKEALDALNMFILWWNKHGGASSFRMTTMQGGMFNHYCNDFILELANAHQDTQGRDYVAFVKHLIAEAQSNCPALQLKEPANLRHPDPYVYPKHSDATRPGSEPVH